MHILFIGGTRFLGAAMAREALARGHAVDLFHRSDAVPAGLETARHLRGDRVTDLSALAQGQWDAVIDTSGYRPRQIESVADRLAGRFAKYVFVSSVSVYANDIPPDSDERAALADPSGLDRGALADGPITGENYGPLKVLCEEAVAARHADRLVLRPTYIIGPDDYSQRFPEWVRRLAAGGEVDAPGPRDAAVQYVDARDLARFAVDGVEQDLRGTFNIAAPQVPFTFEQLLEGIAQGVAPAGTRLRWLTVAEAFASGRDFPLWHQGEFAGFAAVNSDAARAHGLACRTLRDTAIDVLAWTRQGTART